MRKWFWLYLPFSVAWMACLLMALHYLIVHIIDRILPGFHGWKEFLLFSAGPLLFGQVSNYAERRIKKIAADGAEGTPTETPRWLRTIGGISLALILILLLLIVSMIILDQNGWFVKISRPRL